MRICVRVAGRLVVCGAYIYFPSGNSKPGDWTCATQLHLKWSKAIFFCCHNKAKLYLSCDDVAAGEHSLANVSNGRAGVLTSRRKSAGYCDNFCAMMRYRFEHAKAAEHKTLCASQLRKVIALKTSAAEE